MVARPKLLLVAPIPPELEARLSLRFDLVRDRPSPARRLPGFRVAVTTSVAGADAALMDGLPDLELIACNGTGLESIDLEAAARRGISIRNTPDIVTEDTADFAVALVYATARRIAEADRFMRAGRWGAERMTPSRRVHSRTMGIVGLGKIGAAIARRATGIGMKVRYSGPRPKPEVPYPYDPAAEGLARTVDFLVLSCPGGKATHHLVNAAVLRALGPDGILINVSRGSVVDEKALIEALARGAIAGAGLDVFESEPDIDPAFFAFDNVVLQPHYAAVTRETRAAMAEMLDEAIGAFFAGEIR
ncbi:2-hydroxyacid dehydrogenase [Chelativorans sp. AA-79]|uniref:2-hydroxyacid dehydrogenase n=1 Tax=Chelativorans sp. AA-79 TaxID=3028735 RepID=UPI0023F7810D|nr:2-hydroxyacid dehydrogenase [Chelativorans sp. AA-79]WEX08704.1 2-hydroxyacid dehydrogenase [Chelativorans sp. AA-79]